MVAVQFPGQGAAIQDVTHAQDRHRGGNRAVVGGDHQIDPGEFVLRDGGRQQQVLRRRGQQPGQLEAHQLGRDPARRGDDRDPQRQPWVPVHGLQEHLEVGRQETKLRTVDGQPHPLLDHPRGHRRHTVGDGELLADAGHPRVVHPDPVPHPVDHVCQVPGELGELRGTRQVDLHLGVDGGQGSFHQLLDGFAVVAEVGGEFAVARGAHARDRERQEGHLVAGQLNPVVGQA